jgi:hypothetical protein
MVASGRIGLYIGNGRLAHYLTKDVHMKDNNRKRIYNKNLPGQESRAAEIIRMIRARAQQEEEDEMDKNLQEWIEEQENIKMNNPPFHRFKKITYAETSLGLYQELKATYSKENDPDKLKEIFDDHLLLILESVPDDVAEHYSKRLNGLDC